MFYVRQMKTVSSRDLRNRTSSVLRDVADGEIVVITTNGVPVAELSAPRNLQRTSMTKSDVLRLLDRSVILDAQLADDLSHISSETTDDLDALD